MSREYQLNLSTEEISLILSALGEKPFKEVYQLIGKINAQVNEQYSAEDSNDINESSNHPNEQ
ncbi:MAG: hypothetical protein AAFO07_24910 [Bacteroidota bacterium]